MVTVRHLARISIFATLCLMTAAHVLAYTTFEIFFPASVHQEPITGRMLLMVSRMREPEVRLQVGWLDSPPVFGSDVSSLTPGKAIIIDSKVIGFPVNSLAELPQGDYYVQALLNVYTEFHRSDGRVIWTHMDQWEGQQFNLSPGNLFSMVRRVHLSASVNSKIVLPLSEVIPPVPLSPDTEWVKHVKIQSKLLTSFWGRPMYLGAVVLLPRGYSSHTGVRYPVLYKQDHFSQTPAFNFRTDNPQESDEEHQLHEARGTESGYQFFQAWNSDRFPRVIVVTLLHPTPYFDDSYAVDSANNGPYGTAIMTELIPYIEQNFRTIAQPYARILTGGSTGGWESLALQLLHPEFFGSAWVFCPDPIDFRRYPLMNIYKDDNAFVVEESHDISLGTPQDWVRPERSFARTVDGQSIATVRQLSRLEAVLGSRSRSGGQLAAWESTFGPVADDGYPKPLWDKSTGEIDHSVADYMRNKGFDLRYYAETNWPRINRKIIGKLHLYCGDMDDFYLNLGVYLFHDFLKKHQDFDDSVEYGRPLKGHGWQPMTNARLIQTVADRVARKAPEEDSLTWLRGEPVSKLLERPNHSHSIRARKRD